MTDALETLDTHQRAHFTCPSSPPQPGLLLILSAGRPSTVATALRGNSLVIGREHGASGAQSDGKLSRRHAEVRFDGARFEVTDLDSRNGTFADGQIVNGASPRQARRVIRAGESLFVPMANITPAAFAGVRVKAGWVEGPLLAEAMTAAAHAARLGKMLHITGESGSGKEGLARAFHANGPAAQGPFRALNCATIPEGIAERLLFGTVRGAFTGAIDDQSGQVQAAHGGTLFLDEVAELPLAVQAKLLRVLETGEVMPLGAARAQQVDLRFCSATHRDLREQVALGKLREDLYFRIAAPRVTAPPLRDRPEEIPWLAAAEIKRAAPGLRMTAGFVEACLLRVWPGNVRELLAEVRSAAQAALGAGVTLVEAHHLGETAGRAFASREGHSPASARPTREEIPLAIASSGGNVSAAARLLGVHRTQLRRWIERDEANGGDAAGPASWLR